MYKPTFTQPAPNTSFGFGGASTSTPFGQSGFPKMTNSSAFGSPAFGAPSTPMFGGQNQTQTGLFAPTTPGQAFGQPAQPQSSFAFGSTNTTTNLFNQSQQPSSSGLFGSTANSTFGQKAPFATFGSPPSSGIFGSSQSTQPQAQATPLFGQTAAPNTGLFGSASAFSSNQANQQTGTVIKFNPVTGTDTMMKNRQTHQIQTRHHCITFMKEYESKSLEELRYEDYLVNRKGPQQNTGSSGLFGQMSTTTNVGGTGLFGATPSVSQTGFGQTSSVFGAPQNTNLFGQKPAFGGPTVASTASPFAFNPQPTSTVTPFGNTQAKPFGAPTQSLFSTPSTQPTNTFGATNTFGNFGAATSTTSFGLNQNKPSTGTFTLNPPNSTGFNTFGQQQTTLFGGNKTTPNVFGQTSGGFGQPTTSQPTFGGFGTTQPQIPTLFTNPTFNKPSTGGFGTVQPQSNMFMGGMNLNQPQQSSSTGLFGQKTSTSIFGTPSASQQSIPFSGFGQQNVSGSMLNFGGSLLGQNQQQSSTIPSLNGSYVHEQILTITKPYQSIDCLKRISPNKNNVSVQTNTTNPIAIQSVIDDSLKCLSKQVQGPTKTRALSMTPKSDMRTLFEGLESADTLDDENLFTTKPRNPRRLYIKKVDKQPLENCYDTSIITILEPQFVSSDTSSEISNIPWMDDQNRKSDQMLATNGFTKRSSCDPRQRNSAPNITQQQTTAKFGSPQSEQSMLTSTKIVPEKNNTILELSRDDLNASSASTHSENEAANLSNPTGIICTRPGYYTIPSLDELAKMMTSEGRCIVQGFTIGRRNYGNVFFPDTFDVAGINIDEHVHFRTKELVIYVNDENKPPLGHELNRHAQITLDLVYPRDKETMQPILDVDRLIQMNYEDILRASCDRHGTTFIDYRPETGSWVFEVEHFTRYGLTEEEEVIIPKENSNLKRQERSQIVEKPLDKVLLKSKILKTIFPVRILEENEQDEPMDDRDSSIEEIPSDDDIMEMVNEPLDDESSENLSNFRESSTYISPRMQNMKQIFFNDDYRSEASSQASGGILTTCSYVDFLTEEQIYVNELFTKAYQDSNIELESAEQLQQVLEKSVHTHKPSIMFKQPEPVDPFQVISYSKFVYNSVDSTAETLSDTEKRLLNNIPDIGHLNKKEYEELFGDTKIITDMSIARGINCRTSFGKGDHFFVLNKFKNGIVLDEEESVNKGDLGFQLLHLTFQNESYPDVDLFKKHIEEHLHIQLAHGDIEPDQDFPYAFPLQGPKALHQHSEIAQNHYKNINRKDSKNFIVGYTAHLWKLFEALWGEVLELESEPPDDHLTTSIRRSCLSAWLESYMEEGLRIKETYNPQNLTMYDYICAHKLLEASNFALERNFVSLALLLVQMSSNGCLRKFIKEQLKAWQLIKVNKYIDKDVQKMYALLGGIAVTKNETWGIINVCEDLNWLQSYALHLWYLTPSQLTITDITNEYENAFKVDDNYESYAAPPEPLYTRHKKMQSNVPIYDLYYHLLQLYSDSAYPMEKLLNPANYTPDPTDYSLSWFTLENLKALGGYVHLREDAEDKIHERFASQLERVGLWQWAIFILLHIKNVAERRKMVVNVINRNVSINTDDIDYIIKENFVVRELYVPAKYFSHAKGFKAMSDGQYNAALTHFIAANDGEMAVQVFWNHVGPKEMTNKNYKYLRRLTQYMIMGGYNDDLHLIIYYFIQEIDRIMQKIKTGNVTYIRDYLDRITQQLPTICNKIIVTQTRTCEQVLMVAEICQNIINLVKIVIENVSDNDISPLSTVALLASKLPLPPDYILEEIYDVISLYLEKRVNQSNDQLVFHDRPPVVPSSFE